jgi:hypothetical protein
MFLFASKAKFKNWTWCIPTDMITQFIRKRNINTALEVNKNFARVQVRGNSKTFVYKKVDVPASARILTQADDFLNTEANQRINIG